MSLEVIPSIAKSEQQIMVKWMLDDERKSKWKPSENDEVRLYNTLGVLFSRQHLWTSTRKGAQPPEPTPEALSEALYHASVTLTAPGKEGSYVICLYDYPNSRRVMTVPFRVDGTGSSEMAEEPVQLSRTDMLPCGRLDFRNHAKWIDKPVHIAVYQEGSGDNDGLPQQNSTWFSNCEVVFPVVSFGIIAPEKEGQYEVRVLSLPLCGVPMTISHSATFTVKQPVGDKYSPDSRLTGNISIDRKYIVAGETFEVQWDFTNGGILMSEGDSWLMYHFGRPEGVYQTETLLNTITVPTYTGSMTLQSPTEPGTYEIGYFSFKSCQYIANGPTVSVEAPDSTLHFPPQNEVNKEIHLEWTCSVETATPEDRWNIYTDDMSLYGTGPIVRGTNRIADSRKGSGTTPIIIDRPGKFIATYWSAKLEAEISKSKPFEVCGDSEVRDVTIHFTCPRLVPFGCILEAEYCMRGVDNRRIHRQMSDVLGLYHFEDRDYEATVFAEDICRACKALEIVPAHGKKEGVLQFTAFPHPGMYEIRYMTETGHMTHSTIYKCTFEVIDDEEGKLTESFQMIEHDAEKANAGLIGDTQDKSKTKVYSFYNQAQRDMAPTTHTLLDETSFVAPLKSPTNKHILNEKGKDFKPTNNPDLLPFFNLDTEFTGSCITPTMVIVNTCIIITYHVTSGVPLPNDLIVILDDERKERIYSSAEIADAIGRADLCLGSVALRAPEKVGLYTACYFSTKHRSLVIASQPFKVVSINDAMDGHTQGQPGGKSLKEIHQIQEASKTMFSTHSTDEVPFNPLTAAQTMDGIPANIHRYKVVLVAVTYKQSQFELNGAINDVESLRSALIKYHDIPPHNVLVLSEKEEAGHHPNSLNIRKAIRWLTMGSQSGDKLLFHYSGYASMVNRFGTSNTETATEVIIPCDSDWDPSRWIAYDELWDSLFESLPLGVHITCIMDCSNIGNIRDLAVQRRLVSPSYTQGENRIIDKVRNGRSQQSGNIDVDYITRYLFPPSYMFKTHDVTKHVPVHTWHTLFQPRSGAAVTVEELEREQELQRGGTADSNNPKEGSDVVYMKRGHNFIRASHSAQQAMEAFVDGKYHGLFSWALSATLTKYQNVTLGDLMDLCTKEIWKKGYSQVPVLYVSNTENVRLTFP